VKPSTAWDDLEIRVVLGAAAVQIARGPVLEDEFLLTHDRFERCGGLVPVDALDQLDRLAYPPRVSAARHEVGSDPFPQAIGLTHVEDGAVLVDESIGAGTAGDVTSETKLV
jgi:hypothetical protein